MPYKVKKRNVNSGVAHKMTEKGCIGQKNDQKSGKLSEINCEYYNMTNHRTANCCKRVRDIMKAKLAVEWKRKKVRFHDEPPRDT